MKNQTEQTAKNELYYNNLVKNLYSYETKGFAPDVIRANNFQEAIGKDFAKPNLESIQKLDLSGDQVKELFESIAVIKLLITAEDENDLRSNIYHSAGTFEFTFGQLIDEYIEQMNSIDVVIDKLEAISSNWHLRKCAVELFREELREQTKKELAA